MKLSVILSAAALAVSGLPLLAQQAGAAVSQSATASTAGVSANQSASVDAQAGPASARANGTASANAEMRPVNTELVGKLDSKSAKAGDAVVVKTTEKIKTAEGTVIPRGSHLIGHVAAVQAHGSGQADSSMSLVFDRAELKGGESITIHSVIETVAPPVNAMATDSLDSDTSFAAPIGGGARAGGGGRLSGGLVGGAVGSAGSVTGTTTSNLGATTGSAASTLGATTAGAAHSTAGLAGETAMGVDSGLRGTADTTGSLAAHATAIPGVMLAGDASGSASGTLTASRKNIHLDSGTRMVLGLSGAVTQ
jgi:hypothetical protein